MGGVTGGATGPDSGRRPSSVEGQEISMSEPPTESHGPESVRLVVSRRVVSEWEYRTASIESFQVRIPRSLHEWLRHRAERMSRSQEDLVVEVLETSARHLNSPAVGNSSCRDEFPGYGLRGHGHRALPVITTPGTVAHEPKSTPIGNALVLGRTVEGVEVAWRCGCQRRPPRPALSNWERLPNAGSF